MERDFTDVIRNKSQFEESAGRKISDTRQHDGYITDVNLTTDSALQSGKTISEKLQEYKYEVQQETRQTEDAGGYKTETELHNTEPTSMKVVDASGKEEMVSSNLFDPAPTSGKYSGETAYDTATGKYSKAYATYVNARKQTGKTSVEIPMKSVGRHASKAITASEKGHMHFNGIAGKGSPKATDRLKSYKMSDGQGFARPNGIKDTKVIRSSIASKAKGITERKTNLSGKTKGSAKETFGKKLVSADKATGKYKSKIDSGAKARNGSKIRDAATNTALYKMTSDGDNTNSGVEAARGTSSAGYAMYSKLNRKVNNANAQKYVKKSDGRKAGGAKGSGKYTSKAGKSMTSEEAKKRAKKLADQKKVAQKYRAAKKREKMVENTAMTAKQVAVKVAHKLQEIAARNASLIIMVAGAVIAFIAVSAALSSCAMALTGGTSEYVGGLAGSEDIDLTESDSYFTEKEMLLQEKIDKIEEDYPDYDEYIYDVDEIGHDALKLMAFLSAEYETYDLSKIQGLLDEMFDEMYTLTLEPKTEIRTRTVTKTGYNDDGTTYEYEVEEEYEWKMLYVTLKKKDWDSIIEPRFTDDKNKEMYEIYDDTDGAHQAFYNPFEQDWSSKVTSEFGWRIHPISGKEKFHNGIDIGLPTGTQIHACATGKVIQSYYSESAGNYIVIEDETGYTTHYMHLSVRSVSVGDVVKHGDIIGEVGSTGNSTGPHLHLGVKNAGGEWLNPRFMVSSFYKE